MKIQGNHTVRLVNRYQTTERKNTPPADFATVLKRAGSTQAATKSIPEHKLLNVLNEAEKRFLTQLYSRESRLFEKAGRVSGVNIDLTI